MAASGPNPILQLIRRALDDPRTRDTSDQSLLECFVADRDEAAFEVLLRRHGPMVFDLCREMLPNANDAEDAFQATFLILATRAASIQKSMSLASWLHGVAFRVAWRARTAFARRRKHECRASDAGTQPTDDLTWRELRQVVHEELNRLPRRLRDVLTVCYLQGLTQDRAAEVLELPKGTLKGRLERGRALLRARLLRRGFGPTALLAASAWPTELLACEQSISVLRSTLTACAQVAGGRALDEVVSGRPLALVRGFSKAILWTRIGWSVSALVFMGLTSYGLTLLLPTRPPERREPPQARNQPVPLRELVDDAAWMRSVDGIVGLRITAEPARARDWEPIVLTASLRNFSDRPIRVRRPFGRGPDSIRMKGLHIAGQTARLRYEGPEDEDESKAPLFALLTPDETVHDRIVIREASQGFRLCGAAMPNVGRIALEYAYIGRSWKPAEADGDEVWTGRIQSATIAAEVQRSIVATDNADRKHQ